MFQKVVSLVKGEFQPQAAFNDVAGIASFHRVQCSPGIRDAAMYIGSFLDKHGIEKEIMSFPAKSGVKWWSQDSFHEWSCKDAELVLLEDGKRERLCSFQETKTSVLQRSAPTPQGGVTTSIVYIENATDPKAYEGMDVKGKLVFSRGDVSEIAALAVDRFGALGIVVDTLREHPPVRERCDLSDGRQYLAFWPADATTHKALGFVLSPRQGERLRKMFASGKTELKAFARVDSAFYEGTMEVVSAVIPGETDEEVVATAHLCHPEPSANDNASGSGTLMEAARTLHRLINEGRLPRPRRTIRFLWLPEMTGSYAYLATHEDKIQKTVAAINLDMVGENQDLCKSTFIVEKPPIAHPGFGGDLAEAILRYLAKEVPNFGGNHWSSLFRWTVSPFSGGSDHYVWADPSVGVTCPMLIQWPDKFYHTSEDTIDKVDPKMLWLAGSITASYLYLAATATPQDASYLAGEMATRFSGEVDLAISNIMDKAMSSIQDAPSHDSKLEALAKTRRTLEKRIRFLADRKKADIESLLRLTPDSEAFAAGRKKAVEFVEASAGFLTEKALDNLALVAGLGSASELPAPWDPPTSDAAVEARSLVPVRVFRGPFSGIARERTPELEAEFKAFREKYKEPAPSITLLQYWADGKRTVMDIADVLESETGFRNDEMLLDLVKLQAKNGIFKLKTV